MKLRIVEDFPIKGIKFVDMCSLYSEPTVLKSIVDVTMRYYKDKGVTKVLAIESRGFITGAILAYNLKVPLVLARKKGKLPPPVDTVSYTKEYGVDVLEIEQNSFTLDDVVLVHDDVLATGGTILGLNNYLQGKVSKIYNNCILEVQVPRLEEFKEHKIEVIISDKHLW